MLSLITFPTTTEQYDFSAKCQTFGLSGHIRFESTWKQATRSKEQHHICLSASTGQKFKAPICSMNIIKSRSHWSPPCCPECIKLIKVTTDMLWTLLHCGTDDWRGGHFPAGRCFPLWIRRRKYRQAKHFSRLLLTFPPGKPPEMCHCRCELTLYFLSCMLFNLWVHLTVKNLYFRRLGK